MAVEISTDSVSSPRGAAIERCTAVNQLLPAPSETKKCHRYCTLTQTYPYTDQHYTPKGIADRAKKHSQLYVHKQNWLCHLQIHNFVGMYEKFNVGAYCSSSNIPHL